MVTLRDDRSGSPCLARCYMQFPQMIRTKAMIFAMVLAPSEAGSSHQFR